MQEITVLATSVKPWAQDLIRILVDGKVVYIVVAEKTLPEGWQHRLSGTPKLPMIPIRSKDTMCYHLHHTDQGNLALSLFLPGTYEAPTSLTLDGVSGVHHDVKLDYTSFQRLKTFDVDLTLCWTDKFPECLYSSKPDVDATKLMTSEIKIHREISEHGLCPKFLGLVIETRRGVIGFVMEIIEHGMLLSDYREEVKKLPEPDVQAARNIAARLHALGVIHQDFTTANMMRRPDGSMLVIDFEHSIRVDEAGRPLKAPDDWLEKEPDDLLSRSEELSGLEESLMRTIHEADNI
ncbi:hypothetical protein BJ170DRAFT_680787 [Xylariales sp. AK1849]|nr:hypothetical protein BJ170DRAFT_680787 [Xylariales sp. AK1849]